MYVQYKVNVSENQVNTLKDALRLKKLSVFQKVVSDVISASLPTPAQINRLDKAQVEGRRVKKWKGDVHKFVCVLDKWRRM